jgi:GDPmannose 4,6-dehydratase
MNNSQAQITNEFECVKKVIVTGASGQDGSYMTEYLLKNTKHIIVIVLRRTSQAILSNLTDALANPRVKVADADLTDHEAVRRLIREERPDYFINFAAQTFVADSWANPVAHMQTNAISLIHILEAIREYVPHCHVYSAGSSEQFGNVKYNPQDEKHPLSPRSIYGVSKCTAQLICKVYRESYGLYIVHAILFNHESERRQSYFVSRKISLGVARIAAAIKAGKPFEPIELGNIDSKRDWSHAADFMDGVWRMLNQQGSPQEYVLASGETHSVREFVELAFTEAGIDGHWFNNDTPEKEVFVYHKMYPNAIVSGGCLVCINPKFYRPADVEILWGDSTKARRELGWAPKVTFSELVSRMVKHDLSTYKP